MKLLYFLLSILTFSVLNVATAANNDTIMHFTFNEASGTSFTTEEISNIQFRISNLFNKPERIAAIQGNALRLDGFSTYAAHTYNITQVSDKMTIEAWYATEAFSPSTGTDRNPIEGGALISQIEDGAGFTLKIGSYGNVSLDFYADGQKYEVTTSNKIKKYVWNHIVATIDLFKQEAKIYVNGNLWRTTSLGAHEAINFADAPMYLGRHNATSLIEGFNIITLNGAIDDLKVYDVALTESEVVTHYETFAPKVAAETIFEDFEDTDYGNWAINGDAFGSQPATGTLEGQNPVQGFMGGQLVNTFFDGDASQGKLTSPDFTINNDLINFLIGGGNHPGKAEIRLLVNGNIIRTATGNDAEVLTGKAWDVSEFMGATAHIEIVDSVTGGWGHMLIDHITFNNKQELLPADLSIDPDIRFADDYLRPQYHAMPNSSWTNEPYGLTYYKGKYHLFFQKNPNGLWLHFMHWGHLSSPDLVHWKEEKVVFGPSPGFDDFGIWSGTTIKDKNGDPVIFYTGVDVAKAGIGIAYPQDENLIEWEKFKNNPVIPNAPGGYLDFRDPFVWKDQGTYYMIVGAGLANNGGGALPTYKSTDLINWTRINTLFSNSDLEESGFFWEMPLFYPLNDQGDYILAATPLYPDKPANVIYWTGKWDNETFTPYFDAPKLFTSSKNNLLAPAIGRDAEGRITYIGIVPETRNVADQLNAGWRHTFSLPRVIRLLEDATIGHYPHPNLCRLRTNEVSIVDRKISKESNNNLPEFGGNQINLSFKVKADSASRFSLQVLKSADGSQFTAFIFDLERNLIALDTRFAHEREALEEYTASEYIFDFNEEINIDVFIDHSIVEVFVDNLLVLSTRSYPAETSQRVDVVVTSGEIEIVEAEQWDMQAMDSSTGTAVCEPSFLPVALRELPEESEITGLKKNNEFRKSIKLYPNPANKILRVELPAYQGDYKVSILSLTGSVMKVQRMTSTKKEIALDGLGKGTYIVHLEGDKCTEFFKIIIQ